MKKFLFLLALIVLAAGLLPVAVQAGQHYKCSNVAISPEGSGLKVTCDAVVLSCAQAHVSRADGLAAVRCIPADREEEVPQSRPEPPFQPPRWWPPRWWP